MPEADLPERKAPLVVLAAGAAAMLCLVTIFGWMVGGETLSALGMALVPMGPHAALFGLLISSTLICAGRDIFPGLQRGLPILVLVLSLIDLLSILNVTHVLSPLELVLPGSLPDVPSISLHAVLSFMLISLAALTLPPPSKASAAVPIVACLLAIGINLLAVYGYLVRSQALVSPDIGRQIPVFTAAMATALSLMMISLSWSQFRSPAATLAEILRGMQIICGSLLFLTVVLSACFAVIPLYETLLKAAYSDLEAFLPRRQADLSAWLASFERMAALSDMKTDAFTGQSGVETAEVISSESAHPGLFWKTEEGGDVQVFVDTPRRGSRADREVIRAKITVSKFLEMFTGHPPLAAMRGQYFIFSRASPDLVLRVSGSPPHADLVTLNQVPLDVRRGPPDGPADRSMRSIFTSRYALLSGDTRSAVRIGFSSNQMPPLQTAVKDKIFRVLTALFVIVLVSSSVIFLILGWLAKQISLLESRLKQSLQAVEEELSLRKLAQAEAERSLGENEVLLKEVHHRVKNNLQVISSILSLQFRRHPSAEDAVSLEESANRIKSIALLHEALYHSDTLTEITLSNYVSQIIENLRRSYEAGSYVDVRLETGDILLEMDQAIPLGLIVTELLSNSFKYAFPADKRIGAWVKIMVTREGGDSIRFVYSDNGVGFPPGFSAGRVKSLGWRLITLLAQQLEGRVNLYSNGGANVEIRFSGERTESTFLGDNRRYEKAAHIGG